MIQKIIQQNIQRIIFISAMIVSCAGANAQQITDSVKLKSLYRPPKYMLQDTLPASDSLKAREQFVYDSIQARLDFVRDSIAAREKFIRDSIAKRQRVLDSLNILKTELPRMLEAAIKSLKDDIIINNRELTIIGDSMLSNYAYIILPFNLSKPFTPWKAEVNLSDHPVKMEFGSDNRQLKSIQSPQMNCFFVHDRQKNILRINEKAVILNKSTGKLYKEPFDSVFYDSRGRVAKIKRYINFSQVMSNYQKGAPLFVHLAQVKQYDYTPGGQITRYQVVNFCDRWTIKDESKVCNIITYSFDMQRKTYIISRKNDPVNNYSDGTFTIVFDEKDNLKSIAFVNAGKTENWKTHVEVDETGNAKRYLYEINGKINQTLDFNYFLNDPRAKYPVEQIKCTFENDGISYYQLNTTTGKSRTRDRTTGEWSPWR